MDDQLRFSFQQELYSVIWGEGYNRFVFQHFFAYYYILFVVEKKTPTNFVQLTWK
jgi:hypothetical protein